MLLTTIRTRSFYITSLLISGLGMASIGLRQSTYGVALRPDSTLYIRVAENLVKGGGFTSWGDKILLDYYSHVPLFPFALSIINSVGISDKFTAAARLNMLAFGLSILILIAWLRIKIRSRFIIAYVGIACALSPLLGDIHATALTEPLFILFVVAALLSLDLFFDSGKPQWLIFVALFSDLSWLTRYVGISITISTLILLITRRGSPLSQRIKNVVFYSTITIPIIAVTVLWSYLRVGRLGDTNFGPGFDLLISIDTASTELVKWILGSSGLDYLETLSKDLRVSGALLRIAVCTVIAVVFGYTFMKLCCKIRTMFSAAATPITFVFIYMAILTLSLAYAGLWIDDPRFMAPIYIPILVILGVTVDQIIYILSSRLRITIIASLMCFWIVLTAIASYNRIKTWRDYGSGYSSREWNDSETISYLKSNPLDGQIYSNNIRAVYAHMRVSDDAEVYYKQLSHYWANTPFLGGYQLLHNDIHVVWFHGWKQYFRTQYEYGLAMLAVLPNLEIKAVLEDGILFRSSQSATSGNKNPEKVILESVLKDAKLIADDEFNIYTDNRRLIYLTSSCNDTDIDSQFFLHIYPADRFNIPEHRGNLDFNNYDFEFDQEGFSFGERCVVIQNLPSYVIEAIRTGQYNTEDGELWSRLLKPGAWQGIS